MICVTGAAGFIGSSLCRRLLRSGYEVVGVDSLDETLYPKRAKEARLDELRSHSDFFFLERNIATLGESELREAETIFNLAAIPGLAPSWICTDKYFSANVSGLMPLLTHLHSCPKAFLIHASTSSVYGRVANSAKNSEMRPASPYGVSKLAAEHLIEAYTRALNCSDRYSILRLFSVYGPDQREDMAYARFARGLSKEQPLEIFGNGLQSRTNTYIDDVVTALEKTMERKPPGATFDICGTESITVLQAIEILADEMGVESVLRFGPPRLGDQQETRGDPGAAKHLLNWVPSTTIETGLRAQAKAHLHAN